MNSEVKGPSDSCVDLMSLERRLEALETQMREVLRHFAYKGKDSSTSSTVEGRIAHLEDTMKSVLPLVSVPVGPALSPCTLPGVREVSNRQVLEKLGTRISGGDSVLRLSASGTAPGGGGTGREFVRNLHNSSTAPWDKWYHTDGRQTSWILGEFTPDHSPTRLVGYALCTANDCPERDPVSWSLKILPTHDASLSPTDKDSWPVVHRVSRESSESLPRERWQWKYFMFAFPVDVRAVCLDIEEVRWRRIGGLFLLLNGAGVQLGHLHFYQY